MKYLLVATFTIYLYYLFFIFAVSLVCVVVAETANVLYCTVLYSLVSVVVAEAADVVGGDVVDGAQHVLTVLHLQD